MINVKSRRDFAVSVECERSDGSVNQGGKITSNLYVCMHTVPLNCLYSVFVFSKEGAIF